MAADRSGTTVSAVLPRVDAAAHTAALDPVVAKDALLVSDGGASYPPCAAGGWVMDGKGFQVWLSAARGLTRAQRREALAVLSGRSEGEARFFALPPRRRALRSSPRAPFRLSRT